MSTLMDRAVRVTFALVVASGLGFGASTAYANTGLPDCSATAPYQICANHDPCGAACMAYFGPDALGTCYRNCCRCAF